MHNAGCRPHQTSQASPAERLVLLGGTGTLGVVLHSEHGAEKLNEGPVSEKIGHGNSAKRQLVETGS